MNNFSPLLTSEAGTDVSVLDISNEDYHRIPNAVSNSQLSTFEESPAKYHGELTGEIPRRASTPQMRLGSLLHASVLEDKIPVVCPECPEAAVGLHPSKVKLIESDGLLNGHKRGNPWKAYKARFPGCALLMPDEYRDYLNWLEIAESGRPFGTDDEIRCVEHMRESLLAHPKFRELIEADRTGGGNEMTIQWTDMRHALNRRMRGDCVRPKINRAGDIKTTFDVRPSAIVRTIIKYSYDRQHAFYQDGLEQLTGSIPDFVFFFVRSSPPWTCEAVPLSEEWIQPARERLSRTLSDLARRWEINNWSSPTADSYLTLQVPRYLQYREEYEYAE